MLQYLFIHLCSSPPMVKIYLFIFFIFYMSIYVVFLMCHDQIHKLTVSKTQLKIAGVPVYFSEFYYEWVETGLICIFIEPRILIQARDLHSSYFKAWRNIFLQEKKTFKLIWYSSKMSFKGYNYWLQWTLILVHKNTFIVSSC